MKPVISASIKIHAAVQNRFPASFILSALETLIMSNVSNKSLFFYQAGKLITVSQGGQHRAIFRTAEQPLAELSADGTCTNGLLATDDKGSVLVVQHPDEQP
jgi:hypothetical protein